MEILLEGTSVEIQLFLLKVKSLRKLVTSFKIQLKEIFYGDFENKVKYIVKFFEEKDSFYNKLRLIVDLVDEIETFLEEKYLFRSTSSKVRESCLEQKDKMPSTS